MTKGIAYTLGGIALGTLAVPAALYIGTSYSISRASELERNVPGIIRYEKLRRENELFDLNYAEGLRGNTKHFQNNREEMDNILRKNPSVLTASKTIQDDLAPWMVALIGAQILTGLGGAVLQHYTDKKTSSSRPQAIHL